MSRRNLEDRGIRKIGRSGTSASVTLPIEHIRTLGWRVGQKVVVRRSGVKLIIEDWKK